MINVKIPATTALSLLVAASTSHAATYTVDFTDASTAWGSALSFSNVGASGVDLTVSADSYAKRSGALNGQSEAKVSTWEDHGLGICTGVVGPLTGICWFDNHQVDGRHGNDMAVFSFSEAVSLASVSFSHFDRKDRFDVQIYGPITGTITRNLNANPSDSFDFDPLLAGTKFGIGASKKKSEFKITSISFEYTAPDANTGPNATIAPVPLPATGGLILAGLGAISLMRRRTS